MSTESKENSQEGRRDFMKAAAVAGLAAGGVLGGEVKAWAAGEKAVLPDGSALTREQLLTRLGLDPSTPPEAWITIVSCGSNAAALKRVDAERLMKGGKLKGAELGSRLQDLQKMAPARKQ